MAFPEESVSWTIRSVLSRSAGNANTQNAASVATLLLTSDALIAEKPEKAGPAMPGGGGMGGMGGGMGGF